jgi:hypothetical protein
MKREGWFRNKLFLIVIALALPLLFLSLTQSQGQIQTTNVSLVLDDLFLLSDGVDVDIAPLDLGQRDLTNFFDLWVQVGNDKYRYFGDLIFPLNFKVNNEGSYDLILTSKGSGVVLSQKSFEVKKSLSNVCSDVSINLTKQIYGLDEDVQIKITPYNSFVNAVYLEHMGNKYRFVGSEEIAFMPSSSGSYTLLVECVDGSIAKKEFNVLNQTISLKDELIYENVFDGGVYLGPIASQGFEIRTPFGTRNQKAGTIIQTHRGPVVELLRPIPSINKIQFKGLNNAVPEIGLDEIETPIAVNNIPGVRSFAIDPTTADFTDAIVTVTAQGNTLFMCKEYDFETRDCYGSWIRLRDITPGEEYTFMITPEDPLFTETNTSPDCSCFDEAINSLDATITCDTFCAFTIDIPTGATSFFLEEMIYNMSLTITTSAGLSSSTGSQIGYFDRDTTTNNGNEIVVGSSTATTTSSFTWTNSSIPSSGSNSFTDLNCNNWPSFCTYYVYINSTFNFVTPGNARRDVTMNLSVTGIEYTLNYTEPGDFSVTLETPQNNFYSNNLTNTFEYLPINVQNTIDSCAIYTNETSWSIKNTSLSITNNTINSLDVTFSNDGNYAWNVECSDLSDDVFAPTNRTIIIDTTPPNIALISPASSFTETESNVIGFEYNVTDASPIDFCTLNIDGFGVSNQSSPTRNVVSTINHNLQNGVYNWSVSCTDIAGNINTSLEREITVDVDQIINTGFWYETATADCTSPPCQISLAQDIDGVENSISSSVLAGQTIQVVQALSPFLGGNGIDIASSTSTLFSTYFTTVSGGNLQARWYVYSRASNDSDTLLCSNTAGTGISGAAASTGTCTITSETYLDSTDRLYYRIDITNTHPSQTRSFNHAVDHVSSFFNISNFVQIGFLSTNLTSPGPSSFAQGELFNLTCSVTCEFASCLDLDVFVQTNQSGTWTNVGSSGIVTLASGQSNPSIYGTLFNSTDTVTFNLNTSDPGTTSLRCFADSKYQDEFSNITTITVGVSTEPVITLNSPANNSWTNQNPVIFNYTPTTFGSLDYCELYIDGVLNQTNSSPTPNVANTFSVSGLLETSYNWSVSCVDTGSLVGNSSTFYFNIDRTAPYELNIFSPANNSIIYANEVQFNISVLDNFASNLSCELFVDNVLNQTIIVQNNTETQFVASGFDIGNYSWYLSCSDFAGNTNTSGTYNLSIADIPPVIELQSPQNNTGVNSTPTTLTYIPFDGFGIDECRLYINGTLNQTDLSPTANENNTFSIPILEQAYNWNVECIDSNSNFANSSTWIFYGDFTPPSISLSTPLDSAYFELSTVNFIYTPTDNWPNLMCSVNINDVLNATTTATSGVESNQQIQNFADGYYNYSVSCVDIALNQNTSETRDFTINQTPSVVLGNPANNSHTNNSNPLVFYTPFDNDGLDQCDLFLNGVFDQSNQSTIINNALQNFSLSSLTEGVYNWSVSCVDAGIFSNEFTSANKTFTLDLTPPSLDLITPTIDQVINTTSYVFEWNVSDNLANNLSCDLFINGVSNVSSIIVNNNSVGNQTVSGFVSDDYNYSVRCFDLAGNVNISETRNFTVIVPPEVNLISPANDTGDLLRNVTFTYVPSGGTGDFNQCTLILNGQPNVSSSSITANNFNNLIATNLPDGEYEWNVECTDTNLLNGSAPENYVYYVDNEEPYLIELLTPQNDSVIDVNNISLTFRAFDATSPSLSCDVYLTEEFSAPFTIATNVQVQNATNTTIYYLTGDGNYSWYVDCTDKAGLFNLSEEYFFEVIAPPNVELLIPANETWFNQTSVTLTYFPEDDILITGCDLFVNGVFNQSAGTVLNKQNNTFSLSSLSQGEYNWTVECTDADANSFAPSNNTFYVDNQAPAITLNYPSNTLSLNISTISFNFTASDNLAPQLICELFIDDVVNSSSLTVNNSEAYIETISGFNDGNYNWSVACLDLASNSNISSTFLFEVQEPPSVLLGNPLQGFRTNNVNMTVFYTPFDNSLNINECTLILNTVSNVSSLSITHGVQQNLTVTNLDNGSYNWDVLCEDPSGNVGSNGSAKTFYIDLEPPQITLLTPEVDETFNQNDITLTWNATDFNESILISCDINISDPLGERFVQNITGLSGTLFNHTEFALEDGEHFWNVTCRDDLGNENTSITRRFVINQPDLYLDDTRISFSNLNPDLNESINITANVSNIGGVDAINALVSFWLGNPDVDGVLIGNQTLNVSQNTTVTYSVPWTILEGFHTIYVIADPLDTISELNESNNNGTANISVLRTFIDSPTNNSIFNISELEFEFKGQDYTGGQINYTFLVDGSPSIYTGLVTDNITSFENLTLTEGIREIVLRVTDYLGRIKTSTPIFLTIDLTPPTPTILTVNNTWFNTTSPQINISLTDNLASNINYTLYVNGTIGASGSLANATSDLVSLIGLSEGLYELILEGEDAAGNKANSSITIIYVDNTSPTISLSSPSDGANLTSRDVLINYTAFDNLAPNLLCEINMNELTLGPFNITEGVLQSYLIENLSEGSHTWNITCADLAGNTNISETRTFNIFIPPEITLISPVNQTWSPNETNIFSYNVSDDTGILECRLYLNNVLNQTDSGVENNALNNFTVSNMEGVYGWRVECLDNTSFNTLGISETRELYVDLVTPTPQLLTANNTWFNTNPNIQFNLTDNLASTINYQIYVNGSLNASGSSLNNTLESQTLTGLSDGYFEIILGATDLAGNTQNTTPIYIYKDTQSPTITLNSPANGSNTTDINVNLSFTPSDNLADYLMCSITLNSVQIASGINVTNGSTEIYELQNLSGGLYNWNVTCADIANNQNTSETWSFFIPIPDLSVNSSEIYFSNDEPTEGETVEINATIRNIGQGPSDSFIAQFWQGEIGGSGIQIGSNINVSGLLVNESVNVSVNYTAPIGTSEVFIIVDPNNLVAEESELNNNASRNLTVGFWHFALGTTNDSLRITDASYGLLFDWGVSNSSGSNIFVADFEADLNWNELQALGRDVFGNPSTNDFEILDSVLGSTGYLDSINSTYTFGGSPIETITFDFFGISVENVPVTNSTNNSNFKTGILWDTADGGNNYNGSQEIVFITTINKGAAGFDDVYDFEIRIPATLREYNTIDTEKVVFYTEIK